jgi:hypothetical protein
VPDLRAVRFKSAGYHRRPAFEFEARFEHGARWHWTLEVMSVAQALDELEPHSFSRRCLDIWRNVRSQPDRRELAQLAEQYDRELRQSADLDQYYRARARYEHDRQHLVQRAREAAISERARVLEQYRTQMDREIGDAFGLGPAMLGVTRYRDPGALELAERRGRELLMKWLTPAQRASYERDKAFEVTGCDSGTRYRIRHGTQMNVEQLDEAGWRVCGWCFLPEGALVAGDVMLAQKIALETDEKAALKLANRIAGAEYDGFRWTVSGNPGASSWVQSLFDGTVT